MGQMPGKLLAAKIFVICKYLKVTFQSPVLRPPPFLITLNLHIFEVLSE